MKKYRVSINSFGKIHGKIVSATSEEDAVKKSGYTADLKPKACLATPEDLIVFGTERNIDETIEQSLENSPKILAANPAYLRSNEKLEIEQQSNGFYWVLGVEEGGPFASQGEAHEDFKRYGEERLERERRGE